jgi:hypothetical protein
LRVFTTVRRAALAAALIALPSTGIAMASIPPGGEGATSDISPIAVFGAASGEHQHGAPAGHLPARRENFQLVSKLELTGRFGDVVPEQIADVAVHKGFAYLNSWNEPTCTRGGTYVADIRDPANPREIGFLPAPPRSIHGEGAHVVTYNGRDIFVANNEPCTFADPPETGGPGGFDLWDVTNPSAPTKFGLAGVPTGGDTGGGGSLVGTDPPHHIHSTVMWEHGGRLYLMATDNDEQLGHDVDIFDISNPAVPAPVAEYDLDDELFPQIVDSGDIGSFLGTFHHDSKVKIIGGRAIALTSYWDGGYVTYDVTDPRNPTYIGDSSFLGPDPLSGLTPPEGNAHYAEFSHDNRFILAADEDFTTHRAGSFTVEGVEYPASGVGGGAPAATLPDRVMNGPTVYGGYACPGSPPVPLRSAYSFVLDSGEEAILVLQRGPTGDTNNPEPACFPGQKAERAWDAGWRNVLFVNRHLGSAADDTPFCGSGGYTAGKIPVSVCTTHTAAHDIFDDAPPEYTMPYDDEAEMAAIGTVGDRVRATSLFDAWGYAHLYRHEMGKVARVDSWAVEESLDERFSSGFGDLSIHEHAADPTENVSYVAYYAAGARAITFGDQGIDETGVFIDQGGNNFWGVEWFNGPGDRDRLAAFSDRDFGLYILRYTGPGAAQRPVCTNSVTLVPYGGSARVPLPCTDANNNALRRTVVSGPSAGTLSGDPNTGSVTYQHTGATTAPDRFTFKASDGSLESEPATAELIPVRPPAGSAPPGDGGRCFNAFAGTASRDTVMGSPFGDTIRGGAGNDLLDGLGGDDCVFGERGRDQLQGNTGNDRLVGGRHRDRLFGGSGRDVLLGGRGNDHLRGVSGHDRLNGGRGSDFVNGGSNNDRVTGGPGSDRLRGAEGRDRVFGNDGQDWLEAGDARNLLSGGSGNDRLLAANGRRDTIRCGVGFDHVSADLVDRVADDCEVIEQPS